MRAATTSSTGQRLDTLAGGAGSDTYVLARGHGADRIVEDDASAGRTDVALFGADIAADQLWFRQVGNDLEVSVIGMADSFIVDNWYRVRRTMWSNSGPATASCCGQPGEDAGAGHGRFRAAGRRADDPAGALPEQPEPDVRCKLALNDGGTAH